MTTQDRESAGGAATDQGSAVGGTVRQKAEGGQVLGTSLRTGTLPGKTILLGQQEKLKLDGGQALFRSPVLHD